MAGLDLRNLGCLASGVSFYTANLTLLHPRWPANNLPVLLLVMCRAGCYCLQYRMKPELPSGRTLCFSIDLEVTAGPPVGFDIQVRNLQHCESCLGYVCALQKYRCCALPQSCELIRVGLLVCRVRAVLWL